jgi:hypothetical protein
MKGVTATIGQDPAWGRDKVVSTGLRKAGTATHDVEP